MSRYDCESETESEGLNVGGLGCKVKRTRLHDEGSNARRSKSEEMGACRKGEETRIDVNA